MAILPQYQDPEKNIGQAVADYRRLDYSEQWINQRIKTIEIRKKLPFKFYRNAIRIIFMGNSVGVREFVPFGFDERFLACNLHAPGLDGEKDTCNVSGSDWTPAYETV